jgi:hypothetical protein
VGRRSGGDALVETFWWRRSGGDGLAETVFGDGLWRRSLETVFGDGLWRRFVETVCGDGLWRRFAETVCGGALWEDSGTDLKLGQLCLRVSNIKLFYQIKAMMHHC